MERQMIATRAEHEKCEPPQTPVTIIDLDRSPVCFDMDLPMADPCPNCGGFCMKVGDWVCWGKCFRCVDKYMQETFG